MIRRLFIDNYKCFCNSEILMPSGRVLISGPNGAGKTTFFDVLELLKSVICRGVNVNSDISLLGDTYTRWKPKTGGLTQRFELDVEGCGGVFRYEFVVDNLGKQGAVRIKSEKLLFDGHPLFEYSESMVHLYDNDDYAEKVRFGADWSKSFMSSVVDRPENSKLIWFRDRIDKSVFLKPNPWAINSAATTEAKSLDRNMANFAQWFRYLRQVLPDGVYADLRRDLEFALPGFGGMRLADLGDSAKELRVQLTGEEYSLKELSDGQRLIVALYTAFRSAVSEGSVFCVDEPDNFLGLAEIVPLVSTLLEDDGSSGQHIVASHHPEFYNRVPDGCGLWFSRKSEADGSATRVESFESVFGGRRGLTISEVVSREWEN